MVKALTNTDILVTAERTSELTRANTLDTLHTLLDGRTFASLTAGEKDQALELLLLLAGIIIP